LKLRNFAKFLFDVYGLSVCEQKEYEALKKKEKKKGQVLAAHPCNLATWRLRLEESPLGTSWGK
jgi:hypothetical protein